MRVSDVMLTAVLVLLGAGASGATFPSGAPANSCLMGSGTKWLARPLPFCSGTTSALQYDGGFFCGTLPSGSGAPTNAEYVTYATNASLSAERVLTSGTNTTVDLSVAAQAKVSLSGTVAQSLGGTGAGALTCSAGQALTSNGTAYACTGTLTASAVACSGCVADSALTANYSGIGACGANTWASTLNDNGAPTCTQPAFTNISGTVSNAQLASSYSGVGACGANTWASTLSSNAIPTCTQPGFSNLSGTATDAQLASNYSGVGACTNQFVRGVNDNAAPTCATVSLTADVTGTLAAANGGYPWTTVTAASDTTDNTSATATNIANLSWAIGASVKQRGRCYLVVDSAVATTGIIIGVTGPATPTQISWTHISCASASTQIYASLNAFANDTVGGANSAGTTRCVDQINFVFFNSTNAGTVQWQVNTEVNTSQVAVRAGSWCEYQAF